VQLFQLRVRQGGAYQIRSAVRDRESERVGSTSEFVEVPDLSRGKLAVSGIAEQKEHRSGLQREVVMNDFRLGQQLTPGDYTLEVTVTASNAGQNRATASQTAEFHIVE
jgi:hypothetical protein